MDISIKFGDYRSNGSRVRGADYVWNEQTNKHDRGLSHKAEMSYRRFT